MIRFHPDAAAEGLQAELHYGNESAETAMRFRQALSDGFAKISAHPSRWPQDDEGFRRYKLVEFPYLIFYEILGEDIEVHAIAHGARKPGYWHDRAGL